MSSVRRYMYELAACAIALVLFSPTMVQDMMPNTANALTFEADCITKMDSAMHTKEATLDRTKAYELASSISDFQSRTIGYKVVQGDIVSTWNLDTANCNVSWKEVQVNYWFYNATNAYKKTLMVSLDPALTKTTGAIEYIAPFFFTDTYWAGYELAANAGATNPIYQATLTHSIPAVSKPTGITNPCRTDTGAQKPCDVAVWTGLEDNLGGSSYLAQAGSDGQITCTSSTSCTTEYFLWHEFLPDPATTCHSNPPFNAGDSISTTVTNNKKYNISNDGSHYDVSIIDTTQGFGCSTTNRAYSLSQPLYGTYINERAIYPTNGKHETLAKFNTDSMSGTMWYSVNNIYSSHAITTSSTSYRQITMDNGQGTNIDNGGISGGSFTQTYHGSLGTDTTN